MVFIDGIVSIRKIYTKEYVNTHFSTSAEHWLFECVFLKRYLQVWEKLRNIFL